MRNVVSKLAGAFFRYKQEWKWNHEAKREKVGIQHDSSILQTLCGRCLILIPHSDDEWIGCSQVLQSNNEVVLCNMDMEGGDTENLHKERFYEMSRVAKEFSRRLITIKDNKVELLRKTIIEFNPDFVFLPFFIDWHPEHIAVMRMLSSAIELLDKTEIHFQVVTYQISCPIVNGITHALPMSEEEWKHKWSYFKSHYPTQIHIPYLRFSLNEVINGAFIGSFAAEVFCVFEAEEWKSNFSNRIPTKGKIIQLKSKLGSISSMRDYLKKEYN